MSGNSSLLTFTTTSVEFNKSTLFLHPMFTFKADISSACNGFSSNDRRGTKLAEELNKEPISVQVILVCTNHAFNNPRSPYLYSLGLHMRSGESNVFKKLCDRSGDNIGFNLKFSVYLKPVIKEETGPLISSEGMTISTGNYVCVGVLAPLSGCRLDYIALKMEWILTIKIHVPGNLLEPADFKLDEPLQALKMLDEELFTDVTISAGNGAEIKAHKVHLSAASPVLHSTLKESVTGTLDMKEMTEKGVRAFLRYLYSKDLTGPKEDIEVAYDLLRAGHKYHVPRLEALMATHLEEADEVDFGAELAYRMYSFVREWNPTSALKKKAIRIMKYKWEELVASQEYQDLFKDGPNSANAKQFLGDIVKSQIEFCDQSEQTHAPAPNEISLALKSSAPEKQEGKLQRGAAATGKNGKNRDKKKEENIQCCVQ